MARFFFPTTSDGIQKEDGVGTDHSSAEGAIIEGQTYAREMALERLRKGDTNFEEVIEIRDDAGALIGRRAIKVTTVDDAP
jgi:hypothetical protein